MTVQIRKLLTSSFLKLFFVCSTKTQEEASEELSGVVVVAGVVSMSKLREW